MNPISFFSVIPCLLLCFASILPAVQDAKIFNIQPNECVVTIAGKPFVDHGGWICGVYYLESYLLRQYAHSGLHYREIVEQNVLKDIVDHLDMVMVYKPGVVVIQTGNVDSSQLRKHESEEYLNSLEELVKTLTEKKVRVILCSVVPVGSESKPNHLVDPVDGLKTWTDAARDIAARYQVPFVDLFTEAIDWKMLGAGKDQYGAEELAKSWDLFQKQLRFEPSGSISKLDYAARRADTKGANITEIKENAENLEFKLQNEAGTGPVLLQITNLASGNYAVSIDGKALGEKSSSELERGIDLTPILHLSVDSGKWNEELKKGHELSASMSGILLFKLPQWVKAKDFESQKEAAIQNVIRNLERHDAIIADLARPQPMNISITKIKK